MRRIVLVGIVVVLASLGGFARPAPAHAADYTESATVTATTLDDASAASWFGGCRTAEVTYSRYHNYLLYHELIYRYKQDVYWCWTCCWKVTSWTKHAWYDYTPPFSTTTVSYVAAWYPCCHTLVVRSDGNICQGFGGYVCALNSHVYIQTVIQDNGTYSYTAGGNG
jgi:hypothetical protein